MRRRKTTYPPAKTAKGGATRETRSGDPGRAVSIDLKAMLGRTDVKVGARVEIASGLYAGEVAIVESLAGGVIPAVIVRTAGGRTRRVRAVDLVPVNERAPARDPESA